MILTRREALIGASATALAAGAATPATAEAAAAGPDAGFLALLGKSEAGGRDYVPEIEGDLPRALTGALYRNGPGLFERNGYRKRHLLDGDGMIQRLSFSNGAARYQNAFVQTPKYIAEEEAGRYLHATWTTRKPGGPFANLGGGDIVSQAGVTVYPVHGEIVARDEAGLNYLIDPETLETTSRQDVFAGAPSFKAHSKFDMAANEWLIAGQEFGRTFKLQAAVFGPGFDAGRRIEFDSPRPVYIHDFFASQSHFIFVLHPAEFSPWGFLAGFASFTDSLSWKPDQGNLVAVVPRAGGAPRFFDAPASFMWHALNAYDRGDEIVADFCGYAEPDHFIGERAMFSELMKGRLGKADAHGVIRRYVIDLAGGGLREEIIDGGDHDFPIVDPRTACGEHGVGYFAHSATPSLHTGLRRLDLRSGDQQTFDFGENTHVGEPVFIPRGSAVDEGWLIAQCLDGASERSFFALFDAETVGAGPIAKIWLSHHMPISFHGAWAEI